MIIKIVENLEIDLAELTYYRILTFNLKCGLINHELLNGILNQ